MKKRIMAFVLILIKIITATVPILGAVAPEINIIQSDNKFSIMLTNIPTNVTSIQLDFSSIQALGNAQMSWSKEFDFSHLQKDDNGNSSRFTIYVDSLSEIAPSGTLALGDLVVTGLNQNAYFTTSGYVKMVNTDYDELEFNNVKLNFTNGSNGNIKPEDRPNGTDYPNVPSDNSGNGYGSNGENYGSNNDSYENTPSIPLDEKVVTVASLNNGVYNINVNSNLLLKHIDSSQKPSIELLSYENISVKLDKVVVSKLLSTKKTLEINTKVAGFILDVSKIKLPQDELKNTELQIGIKQIIAQNNNIKFLTKPVSFTLTYSGPNGTKEILFNDYVKFMIKFNSDKQNLTAVKLLTDGNMSPVINKIEAKGDEKTAVISSLSNNTYAVVEQKNVDLNSLQMHWAFKDILDYAKNGIITEIESFKPDEKITRGEFTEIVIKALGIYDNYKEKSLFADVNDNTKYKNAILAAKKFNIITGYTDNTFKPNEQITREEVAIIINNIFKLADFKIDNKYDLRNLDRFKDRYLIGAWAVDEVCILVQNKILFGDDLGNINPKGNISKAETVSILSRICSIIR